MGNSRKLLETIHLAALGTWVGMILTTGVTAAVMFPTLRDLGVHADSFAAYPKDHFILVAGTVMQKLFAICDWAGAALVAVAAVTLAARVFLSRRQSTGVSSVLRVLGLMLSIAILTYTMASLRPRMNGNIERAWESAKVGDVEAADHYREAFSADHPEASRLMVAQLICVALAFVSGLVHVIKPVPQEGVAGIQTGVIDQ